MNSNEIIVRMISDRWFASIKNFDALLTTISDEDLQKEISPGRNRGIYLLGHLIAVHDDMIALMNFGDKLYPELKMPFIDSPDKAVTEIPVAKDLRAYWNKMNEVLTQKFQSLQADQWFEKHNAVSAEDFMKEPHRNKLNILLTRTTHLAYHTGQFKLIK